MITGRILSTAESTDGRKNIAIKVEFSEDGVVIVPEWTLWAQFSNFIGLSTEEIINWITLNIQAQIGNLILARSKTVLNQEFIDAIEKLKATAIGQADKTIIPIENMGITFNVTINSDGTYTTDRVG